MIHFTLPLVYYNQQLNNKLRQLSHPLNQTENYFKIKNIVIDSFYGSIPFFIYNGGVNSNIVKEKFLLDKDLFAFFNESTAPIRLDCSNNNLNINDLNYYFNLILQYGNTGSNFIEISDLELLSYIKDNGFHYEYIFSKNAYLKHPYDIDIINSILNQNLFHLIELPQLFNNDLEFLNNLIDKNHIEITIGNKCQNNCKNFYSCIAQEQQYQINYSNKSNYYNCDLINNYTSPDELTKELNHFIELGFTHFKIDTPPLNQILQFQQYLIKNLINDKYQLTI